MRELAARDAAGSSTCADAHAHAYAYAYAHPNPYANTDTDADADANTDADTHADDASPLHYAAGEHDAVEYVRA